MFRKKNNDSIINIGSIVGEKPFANLMDMQVLNLQLQVSQESCTRTS